jgi:hypothetical protein
VAEDRLARIETKLDRMADAITTLARIEERMAAQHDTNHRFGTRLDSHDERLRVVERGQSASAWVERGAWVIVAVVVAWIFKGAR